MGLIELEHALFIYLGRKVFDQFIFIFEINVVRKEWKDQFKTPGGAIHPNHQVVPTSVGQ